MSGSPVPLSQLDADQFPVPRSSSGGVFSCQWRGVVDPESRVQQYAVAIGIGSSTDQSVLSRVSLDSAPSRSSFTSSLIASLDPSSPYYVTLFAINGAELESVTVSDAVYFDISSPIIRSGVFVVPNFKMAEYVTGVLTNLTFGTQSAKCLLDTDVVSIIFDRPEDSESGDAFVYELGVGLLPGSNDILRYESFSPVPLPAAGSVGESLYHRVHPLDFAPIGRGGVYFSVRARNEAGLYSTLVSEAVFLKSNSTLERNWIFDGMGTGTDIDYQAATYEIGSSFFFGVNCPIRRGQWAVESADGNLTQPYVELNIPRFQNQVRNTFHVISDQVQLFHDETYRVLVQVTDFSGEVHALRSDGVTVSTAGLIPGRVRDGPIPEQDLNYQESVTTLSACWSGFGDGSPEQTIAYYEVAAGSGRDNPSTRSNIAPYTNVGLNRTHTFTGLELNAETVAYFVTVRAYSVAGLSVEAHSNGIIAGLGHTIIPGTITVPRFQADATMLSAYWSDFESSLPIRQYEWGLGTEYFSGDRLEQFCADTDSNFSDNFDVSGFNLIGLDTYVVLKELSLQDNTTYYFTLRVLDQAKKCIAVISPYGLTIDQTPPTSEVTTTSVTLGPIQSRRRDTEFVIYISEGSTELEVEWTPFVDEESAIDYYEVGVHRQFDCGNNTILGDVVVELTAVEGDDMQIRFTNIPPLEVGMAYVGVVQATNGAGVTGRAYSQPFLLDSFAPVTGEVKDGENWNKDIVYQSDLSMLSAVFTHAKLPPEPTGVTSNAPCPRASFFDLLSFDTEWGTIPSPVLIGYVTSSIGHRDEQVTETSSGIRITMLREQGATEVEVISGTYQTYADFSNGGTFQADIMAAAGQLDLQMNSVTSILFIDSDETTNVLAKLEPERPDFDFGEAVVDFRCFGVQIYRDFSNSGLALPQSVVLWAADTGALSQPVFIRRNLPSVDLAGANTYRVEFEVDQRDTDTVRTAHLYVNDALMVSLQGVPPLSNTTRVVFHLLNRLGYVPPRTNPGQALSVSAVFANVTLPSPSGHLCDAGTPFHSRQSPIVEFLAWAGTRPGLADVEEMMVRVAVVKEVYVMQVLSRENVFGVLVFLHLYLPVQSFWSSLEALCVRSEGIQKPCPIMDNTYLYTD